MYKYTFKGCVYPRRIKIDYRFRNSKVKWLDINVEGILSADFSENSFITHFETKDSFSDSGFRFIGCVAACIQGALLSSISDMTFMNGVGVIIDMEYFVDPNTGDEIPLPFHIPVISDNYKDNLSLKKKIHDIYNGRIESQYIQKFFSDFNYAMLFPNESGFYCYRSIESLACFFKTSRDEQMNGSIWEKFRASLGIERPSIDMVKQYADPSRHGDAAPILTEEKAEIYKITANILEPISKSI